MPYIIYIIYPKQPSVFFIAQGVLGKPWWRIFFGWWKQWMRRRHLGENAPIPFMYGIFTYIWWMFMVNVGKYTIHGWYGIANLALFCWPKIFPEFGGSTSITKRWTFAENNVSARRCPRLPEQVLSLMNPNDVYICKGGYRWVRIQF